MKKGFWIGSQGIGKAYQNKKIIRFAMPYKRKDGVEIWKPVGVSGFSCWERSKKGNEKLQKEVKKLILSGYIQIEKPYAII